MRIVHIITDLRLGGAQTMLFRLLSHLEPTGLQSSVVTMVAGGEFQKQFESIDVPVYSLGMQRNALEPRQVLRLGQMLDKLRPDLVQTWMYHADLLGGLAARWKGLRPMVWNIRHSNLDAGSNRRLTRWVARACAVLSHSVPDAIICNSFVAGELHAKFGYTQNKLVIIPNGFDTGLFRPDRDSYNTVRQELGLSLSTPLVGIVGRFHTQKDHRTFIQALSVLHRQRPDVHFLLSGNNVSCANPELTAWIAEAGVGSVCHLLGQRNDMPRLMAALDILCSSSLGEGFPNVVGEAMSCGVPCVVTDVGDSAYVVGDFGAVVPPRRPDLLADAMANILAMEKSEYLRMSEGARSRILDHYSLHAVAGIYSQLYSDLIDGNFPPRGSQSPGKYTFLSDRVAAP